MRRWIFIAATLAGVLAGAGQTAADPSVPSPDRLARLMGERGAIRRHLEAAFPVPGADLGTPVVGLYAHADGMDVAQALDDATTSQAPPGKRRGVNWGLVLLGVLVAYATLYLIAFSQGFDP
jgi:hypothetical protein